MKKILRKLLTCFLALTLALAWLFTPVRAPGTITAQAAPSAAPSLPSPGGMNITLNFPAVLTGLLGPDAFPDPSEYPNVVRGADGSVSITGSVSAELYNAKISSMNIAVQSYILQYSYYIQGLVGVDYSPDFANIVFYYDPSSFTGIEPQLCINILLLAMMYQSYLQYPAASNFTTISFVDSSTGQTAYAVDSGALAVQLQQLQAQAAAQ